MLDCMTCEQWEQSAQPKHFLPGRHAVEAVAGKKSSDPIEATRLFGAEQGTSCFCCWATEATVH